MQPASSTAFLEMNCDPIARIYRWAEYAVFGPFLWRCRCTFLDDMRKAPSILLLGEGDGRFLKRLLAINSQAQIDCVDLSARMLQLARQRMGPEDTTRVTFHQADIRTWEVPPKKYDLIVSHFVIDCFCEKEIPALLARLAQGVKPRALWVLSEFQVPAHSSLRFLMSAFISLMYTAFRWTTGLHVRRVPPYQEAMQKVGFKRLKQRLTLGGLLSAEEWERD